MVKEDAEYSTKEEKEEKEEDKIKQYKAAKMFKLLKIYDNRSIPLIKDEADWQEFENILKKNELKVMAWFDELAKTSTSATIVHLTGVQLKMLEVILRRKNLEALFQSMLHRAFQGELWGWNQIRAFLLLYLRVSVEMV